MTKKFSSGYALAMECAQVMLGLLQGGEKRGLSVYLVTPPNRQQNLLRHGKPCQTALIGLSANYTKKPDRVVAEDF